MSESCLLGCIEAVVIGIGGEPVRQARADRLALDPQLARVAVMRLPD